MPLKPLPSSPSLDHLKHQARDLQNAVRDREAQAAQRIREFHPRFARAGDDAIFASPFPLSDAQLTVAREYGLPSWAKLRAAVLGNTTKDASLPRHEQILDPLFRQAVDRLDAGDEAGLLAFLQVNPELVHRRVTFPVRDYFGEPTLLEFVAENPVRRGTLPPNIVDIARLLLAAGAKEDSAAINRTLGLVASGMVARKAGVQVPLIDLLCDFGADPDGAMPSAIVHGEFAAVEALIRRGAHVDLAAAAATGRNEEFLRLLPSADAQARHRALAYAAQFGHAEIVRELLHAGEAPSRYNPVGCHAHSTPLHQAALEGHLDVVRLLVERGADTSVKDIMYGGTPLGWAEHGRQTAVADYLRSAIR